MNNKLKYILLAVLILDIFYLGLYTHNRLSRKKYTYNESSSGSARDKAIYEEIDMEYGDLINGHELVAVTGETIDIKTTGKSFKLLKIYQPSENEQLDIDDFMDLYLIKKEIEGSNVDTYYILINDIDRDDTEQLIGISEKLNIQFAVITKSEMKEYYRLPHCNCGYTILLDTNNKIRISNIMGDDTLLLKMIRKELTRTIS